MQGLFGGTLAGGSDVLGIAIVLAVALNLMNLNQAKYAAAPCDIRQQEHNASSLDAREGPARSSRAPRRSTFDLLIYHYQRIVIIRISY